MLKILAACVGCAIFASCLFAMPNQDTKYDCILTTYNYEDGQYSTAMQKSQRIAVATGERVITYPAGYVPILVPKGELNNLKKQLGSRMVILSPNLR